MVAETRTPEEEEDHGGLEASLPVPPDGGWGWVVVAASFMVNLIVDGVCYSFGVFYVEYLAYFQSSKAKTTLVGALLPSMYLLIGPLVSALANKFGCRAVSMAGSVVACCAFVCSTFSTTIEHMIVIYGVFGGIGFGLMYLPSIVIVSFYFDKRRALATGIAVCGSGVGTFVFAPFGKFLLSEYGWKGANWILGALMLNCGLCGALYRPLVPHRARHKSRREVLPSIKTSIIMQKIQAEKERQRTVSTGSLDNTIITAENMLIKDPDILRQVQEIIIAEEEERYDRERQSVEPSRETLNNEEDEVVGRRRHSADALMSDQPTDDNRAVANPLRHNQLQRLIAEDVGGSRNNLKNTTRLGSSVISLKTAGRKHTDTEINRPMYRKDIFYTGSVTSVAEYKSAADMSTYMSSIASIPSTPKNEDALFSKCLPFLHALRNMFDLSLLRSPTFIILLISIGILAFLGFFIPYLYIVETALLLGIGNSQATFLLSIVGITNIVGRILAGWLADRPWADCVLIHNVALLLAGLITCVVPLLKSYFLLCIYSAFFGVFIAAFIALRSIVAVELLGLERLTNSFGLMILFQGAASLVGSPMAGALFDATNSYTVSFVASGCVISAGALMSFSLRAVSRWENRRADRKLTDSQSENGMLRSSEYIPVPTKVANHPASGVKFDKILNTNSANSSDSLSNSHSDKKSQQQVERI